MKELKVRLTFTEEVLGTSPNNKELHDDYIASKAPDAKSREEEIAAIGVGEAVEKTMTVFPRMDDGTPFIWNYQIKGFFKDACKMLKKADGCISKGLKAYKQAIDGQLFIRERMIPIHKCGQIGECQRPLRAATPLGERVALAHSETVPANSSIEFTVIFLNEELVPYVEEWLSYGSLRGIGQWRNSGKGTFTWEEI